MFFTLIKRMKTDDMARHGLMMAAIGLLVQFLHYLYQLSMSILLSPAQFATLYSLFSIFIIIQWLPQSLQAPITKFVSTFKAQGKIGKVNYLWRFSLKRTLLIGSGVFAVLAAISPLVSGILHIDNSLYPIILFSSFILAFSTPVNFGILRGLQRFVALGFTNTLRSALRLCLAFVFVYFLGMGIYGGLLAIVIAYCVAFSVTMYLLKGLSTVDSEKFEVTVLKSYANYALLALVLFAILTHIDVVLARHYLGADDAGNYSAISVLGRVALFAPAGIAIAMFPKTSELFETGRVHGPLLKKAMSYVLFIGGGIIILYWLFPGFMADFVLRGKYPFVKSYLFRYGLAMLFFAVSNLLITYYLSLNQTRKVVYTLLTVAILHVGLIALFHSSIAQFVNVMLLSSSVCLALMVIMYLKIMGNPSSRLSV